MCKKAYARYNRLQELLETDAEYLGLEQGRLKQESAFRAVMKCLTKEQQMVITAYIGICAEKDERALEITCFLEESATASQDFPTG